MSGLQINPNLKNIPTYQPGRPIEDVARELGLPVEGIIKMASNENPFGPSPVAVAAMEKALGQLNLYPDGNAFYLKQKLAAHVGVQPVNLILGNGSNEIIEFVGHALLGPGTEVVVSQYCFAVYPMVTQMFGAKLVSVPANNYGHDLQAMLRAITPQTRIMFVANPNNPTGTIPPRADLVDLINNIPPHVLLVMDEAYIEFLEDIVDFLPFVRREMPNLILMRTFSKIYGLAGLRVGYGIAAKELVAALDDTEHVERTRANNFAGRQHLEGELRKLKLMFVPSHGNFVLVKVGDGQKAFFELQKLGVIVRPMAGYSLPEFIRISIGTAAENTRCIDALRKVLR